MTSPARIWERWGKSLKNSASTSVLALPDRLLALWEGGKPHALDLDTLETIGTDNLGFDRADLSLVSSSISVDSIDPQIPNYRRTRSAFISHRANSCCR